MKNRKSLVQIIVTLFLILMVFVAFFTLKSWHSDFTFSIINEFDTQEVDIKIESFENGYLFIRNFKNSAVNISTIKIGNDTCVLNTSTSVNALGSKKLNLTGCSINKSIGFHNIALFANDVVFSDDFYFEYSLVTPYTPPVISILPYSANYSLRFNDDDSAYLNTSFASDGNRTTWTWSGWVKRSGPSSTRQDLFSAGTTTANDDTNIYFNNNGGGGESQDILKINWVVSGSAVAEVSTSALYRDPSKWMHVVVMVDTTEPKSDERVIIYIDGEKITDFAEEIYPTQNYVGYVNDASYIHNIGAARASTSSNYYDGYLSEIYFIDGAAVNASEFGEFNSNGKWVPKNVSQFRIFKKISGTQGTTGGNSDGSRPDSRAFDGTVGGTYSSYAAGRNHATMSSDDLGHVLKKNYSSSKMVGKVKIFSSSDNDFGSMTLNEPQGRTFFALEGSNDGGVTNTTIMTYLGGEYDDSNTGDFQSIELIVPQENLSNYTTYQVRVYTVIDNSGDGTTNSATGNQFDINNTVYQDSIKTLLDANSVNETHRYVDNYITEVIFYEEATAGNYGENGFYLDFSDPLNIGADRSGNGNNFTLNNIEEAGGLLLISDTTDGSTTFTDSSGAGNTFTTTGTMTHEDTTSKFGSTSIYLSGTSNYLTVDEIDDFDFGEDDFTIDFWINISSSESNYGGILGGRCSGCPNDGYQISLNHVSYKIGFYADISGSSSCNLEGDISFDNTWRHYAFVRKDGNLSLYENGNLLASTMNCYFDMDANANGFRIGKAYNNYASYGWSGSYLDQLRIVNGKALWSDEFTPESSINYSIDFRARDLVPDVPTNNYAVITPLSKIGSGVLSNGNLHYSAPSSYERLIASLEIPDEGKWAFQVKWSGISTGSGYGGFGVVLEDLNSVGDVGRTGAFSSWSGAYGIVNNAYKTVNGSSSVLSGAANFNNPEFIEVLIDRGNTTLQIKYDGTIYNITSALPSGKLYPALSAYSPVDLEFDFGQGSYVPPSGYSLLTTRNLPNPLYNASKYFEVIGYTGSGVARNITSLLFEPDLIWIKDRTSAYSHRVIDSYRGETKELYADSTNAEATDLNGLTQFLENGFELGTGTNGYNNDGDDIISWIWQENYSSKTDIVTYIGDGVSGLSISHDLNLTPEFIIVKNLNNTGGGTHWEVYHKDLGSNSGIQFSLTNQRTTTTQYWSGTNPNSTHFFVGTDRDVNYNGDTFVAYLFSGVEGFSKFGSYYGNGNSDGTFVYTGFKPKFVIIKRVDSTNSWMLKDNFRDPFNPTTKYLQVETNSAETGSTNEVDFLSNGFKMRATDAATNANGGQYIYIAFADVPFK